MLWPVAGARIVLFADQSMKQAHVAVSPCASRLRRQHPHGYGVSRRGDRRLIATVDGAKSGRVDITTSMALSHVARPDLPHFSV